MPLLAASAFVNATSAVSTPFKLYWTAPGDDSLTGRAKLYDLRYSTQPLTEANFRVGTPVPGLPVPALSGKRESTLVAGLTDGVQYFLAIKTVDDVGNWSRLSNVFKRVGQTTGREPAVRDFALSLPWPNPARTSARWAWAMPTGADLELEVFDAQGRHVRTVARGPHEAGQGELVWDLRDENGEPSAAGLYFARARVGTTEWRSRVFVVR